jgi:hypothetical protein
MASASAMLPGTGLPGAGAGIVAVLIAAGVTSLPGDRRIG